MKFSGLMYVLSMRRNWIVFTLVLAFLSGIATANDPGEEYGPALPSSLTPEELTRLDEIGLFREITPPPPAGDGFRLVPEYGKADGVLFAWVGAYTTLVTQLITTVSLTDTAWVIVATTGVQASVTNILTNAGADMSRVQFIINDLNSIWIRDYGPWWGLDEYGRRGIVDWIYNRPRPLDDVFPQNLADLWDIPYYGPDIVHTGGNFLVDGHGRGFSSTLVQDENPGMSDAEMQQIFREYCGLDTLILLTPMQFDGTGHEDMFCKLLNDSTWIVGYYETPADGAGDNYNILNENAAMLGNMISPTGNPYTVERILMPPYTGVTYTYTNSLIVNNLVLVPIYGFDTDDEALALYESLMPGYTVLGFDSNAIIPANGAVHCITKLVMSAEPLDCVLGDLNGDFLFTVQDLVILINVLLGYTEQTPEYLCAGDLNEDALLSVQDVVLLVQQILGI